MNADVTKGADGDYELAVSLQLYSLEAVKKTAYKFTDRFGVFLTPSEDGEGKVIVSFNGEHRAYPLRILNLHEMANDVVGGVPFALAY